VASLLIACAAAGCGHSTQPTAPTATTVAGRWEGTIQSPVDGRGTISLQLTQSGLDVAGQARLSQDGISDVPGTFNGVLQGASPSTVLQYTVTYEYGEHCAGSFSGTVTLTAREMDGQYSGRNCVHEFAGALHALKAP